MRSFRSKLLSAFAWTAPVLAAVLPSELAPSSSPTPSSSVDGKLLAIDLHEHYAQATFSVPCAGCLGQAHTDQDDESLILSFKTHAHDQPCGSANISLNGAYLPQEWHGDFASGSGSYARVADLQAKEWYNQHDLDLEWESTCLHGDEVTDDAAQVLTVNIKSIDGKPINQPSGFTISFKQSSPPQLLRLEAIPNRSATNKENAESWRQPPSHLRLVLSESNETQGTETVDPPGPASLEDDILALKKLIAQANELHLAIKEKKKHIEIQLSKDAHNITEELRKCTGITCFFKTIANKAHSAWKIIEVHFHYQGPPSMGHPDEVYAQAWRNGHPKQIPESNTYDEFDDSDLPSYTAVATSVPSAPAASRAAEPPVTAESTDEKHELPPRPPRQSPYLLAAEIALGIICCGCLFSVIRHKCSTPRSRTERAARQEERRNEREYRRAARKLAWRRWWCGNWRDKQRIQDYEEKRALIAGQEEVLENAMQTEIRHLRTAHDLVNDLVRAEEGRNPSYHNYEHPEPPYSPISTASTYPPTSIPEVPSRPLSRTDSLPSYRSGTPSEPPSYEDNVDMSRIVANGFRQYTPSTTSEASSRWTPDSSVVDVSPRPSAETLRYAETINTCMSESEDEV